MIRINNLISSFLWADSAHLIIQMLLTTNGFLGQLFQRVGRILTKVKTGEYSVLELSYTDLDSANQYCYRALELSKKKLTGPVEQNLISCQKITRRKFLEFQSERALAIWDSMCTSGASDSFSGKNMVKTLNNCGLGTGTSEIIRKQLTTSLTRLKSKKRSATLKWKRIRLTISVWFTLSRRQSKKLWIISHRHSIAQKKDTNYWKQILFQNRYHLLKQGKKNVSAKNSSGSTKIYLISWKFPKIIHIREEIGMTREKQWI